MKVCLVWFQRKHNTVCVCVCVCKRIYYVYTWLIWVEGNEDGRGEEEEWGPAKRKSGTCIQWNTTQPQKRTNNAICNNMEATRDSHTK